MWELDRHMHSYIAPSLMKRAQEMDNPLHWLIDHVAESRTKDGEYSSEEFMAAYHELVKHYADVVDKPVYWNPLIEELAESAKKYGATTVGGHAFYLDGWTSVPFCSDEECQDWYG